MNVMSFVHEGLGNSSYLIELGAGAALVDPDRSAGRYLQLASARGVTIEAIFETHLHADFVSGAREAAAATGAAIYLPAGSESRLQHRPLAPGERAQLDGVEVEAVGSPGHTPEHLAYVFRAAGQPDALFSGGSLIAGGAARTDLISPEMTDPLTRAQHRTLRKAFAALRDDTLLFPTHGGGSFCSAGAGGERTSTLGNERAHNPLLEIDDEDEFARWFPSTFPAAPDYFFRMRAFNQAGPKLRREISEPPALSPSAFRSAASDALIVDSRPVADYARAHIGESLSNALRPQYALWLGWIVPPQTPLLFVTKDGLPAELVDETLLVGYERFAGWLEGGIDAWRAAGLPLRETPLVAPREARAALAAGAAAIDVREPGEWASGHIDAAIHVPLGALAERASRSLPRDRPLVTYCGMGERASMAASILERAGFAPLMNLAGGIGAWKEAGYDVVTPAG
jgi:glyoxylase-like metal-dependent hydrolase (beta-lactamase superfamily II)/rhodanese-related sulfurtransferase